MLYKKNYIIEITSPADGSFIGLWENTYISFSKELNAGVGECTIILGRDFDYSQNDILEGNNVEIRVSDKDTTDTSKQAGDMATRIIYRGYISKTERIIDEKGNQRIIVRILGHYTKLSLDFAKSGANTTLYSTATGFSVTSGDLAQGDIGLLMRELIDLFVTNNPNDNSIGYFSEDIPDAGVSISLKMKQKTYREAMDILKDMAPSGVYWYADEYGRIKFKTKDDEPTHNFIFGKHFNEIRVEKSIENIRNVLLLWNGEIGGSEIYSAYEDANSIAQHGRRAESVNNYSIGDSDAADAYGVKFLAENKNPDIKVIVKIFDNNSNENYGYDIESISPGDTCSFLNFNLGFASDIFEDNMIITRVEYTPEYAIIEVEKVKSGLLDIQNKQNTQIKEINTGTAGIPESYT